MPWEKQFRTDEALSKAMHAFWARGYDATSMQDLVTSMGINRASIYATFGDKRSLFIKALRAYDERHRAAFLERLRQQHPGKAAIVKAFDEVIASALKTGSRDGCLLVNTALELSPHDEAIADIVSAGLHQVETFFRDMIKAGQALGEIRVSVDAEQTAQALLSLFIGLRVLTRSRPEKTLFKSIARQAEAMLA